VSDHRVKFVAAVAAVAFLSTSVAAQEKEDIGFAGLPAAAVKARQDFMRAQAADAKTIRDYATGKAAKAEAEKAIADLQLRNGAILMQLVPGTSTADLPGLSFAKPAAFTDKAKLEAIVAELKAIEDRAAAAIRTGTPEQAGAAAADIGKVGCAACHNTYRERRSA
jgi:cytochrome c556